MRQFFWVAILLIVLSACSSTKQASRDVIKEQVNKEEKTVYRDTVFLTSSSEAKLAVPVLNINAPLYPNKYINKSGNATVKVIVKRDTIFVTATCDSLAIKAQLKEYYQKLYERKITTSDNTKKTGITTFKYILSILGAIIAGVIVGIILKTFFL